MIFITFLIDEQYIINIFVLFILFIFFFHLFSIDEGSFIYDGIRVLLMIMGSRKRRMWSRKSIDICGKVSSS